MDLMDIGEVEVTRVQMILEEDELEDGEIPEENPSIPIICGTRSLTGFGGGNGGVGVTGTVVGMSGGRSVVLVDDKVRLELKRKQGRIEELEGMLGKRDEEIGKFKEQIKDLDGRVKALEEGMELERKKRGELEQDMKIMNEANVKLKIRKKEVKEEIGRLREKLAEIIGAAEQEGLKEKAEEIQERTPSPEISHCQQTSSSPSPAAIEDDDKEVESKRKKVRFSLPEEIHFISIRLDGTEGDVIAVPTSSSPKTPTEPIDTVMNTVDADTETSSSSGQSDTQEGPPPSPSQEQEHEHAVDESLKDSGNWCKCGVSFTSRQKLSMHVRDQTIQKHFVCTHCPKKYYGTSDLRKHLKTAHGIVWEETNGCRDCGSTFSTRKKLLHHMRDVHENGPLVKKRSSSARTPVSSLPPSSSSESSSNEDEVSLTTLVNDESTLITDQIAAAALLTLKTTSDNTEESQNEKSIEDKTEERNTSESESGDQVISGSLEDFVMPEHGVLGMHGESKWLCLCGQKFTRENSLQEHITLKLGLKMMNCNMCSQSFPRPDYLKIHLWKEHNYTKQPKKQKKRMRVTT